MRALAAAFFLFLSLALPARQFSQAQPATFTAFVPQQILVRTEPGTALPGVLLQLLSAKEEAGIPDLGIHRLRLPQGMDEAQAALQASQISGVLHAELNYMARAQTLPVDALYQSAVDALWWYKQIQADLAYRAYTENALRLGTTITVAVIDTGYLAHADMDASRVLPGWNVITGDNQSADDHGHGTFVSGILMAKPDSAGMLGVAFGYVQLLPIKALDSAADGTIYDLAMAMKYATDAGARVINMSLGLPQRSDTLEQGVAYASRKNAVVVAATANKQAPVYYPAAFSNVIAVGSVTKSNERAYYSNYGKVDLCAPGGDGESYPSCTPYGFIASSPAWCSANLITSFALPVGMTNFLYNADSGTSFACPMVAGAAALLLAQDNSRSPADVLRILTQTADPTRLGPGYNRETGWGRLNVYKALMESRQASLSMPAGKIYPWPNPYNPEKQGLVHFTFMLSAPADTQLRLYDAGGELVWRRDLTQNQTVQGMNIADWDGKNGGGATVANGVYKMVALADGKRMVCNLAVLR
jgi:thermitase